MLPTYRIMLVSLMLVSLMKNIDIWPKEMRMPIFGHKFLQELTTRATNGLGPPNPTIKLAPGPGRSFCVNRYLEIVLSKFSVLKPPPCLTGVLFFIQKTYTAHNFCAFSQHNMSRWLNTEKVNIAKVQLIFSLPINQ